MYLWRLLVCIRLLVALFICIHLTRPGSLALPSNAILHMSQGGLDRLILAIVPFFFCSEPDLLVSVSLHCTTCTPSIHYHANFMIYIYNLSFFKKKTLFLHSRLFLLSYQDLFYFSFWAILFLTSFLPL